jgi:hypothetical protein
MSLLMVLATEVHLEGEYLRRSKSTLNKVKPLTQSRHTKADIFQEGRQTFGPFQALIKINRKQRFNLENER